MYHLPSPLKMKQEKTNFIPLKIRIDALFALPLNIPWKEVIGHTCLKYFPNLKIKPILL